MGGVLELKKWQRPTHGAALYDMVFGYYGNLLGPFPSRRYGVSSLVDTGKRFVPTYDILSLVPLFEKMVLGASKS